MSAREGREMDAEAGEEGAQPAGAASTSGAAVPFGRSSSRLGAPGAESFDGALRVCLSGSSFLLGGAVPPSRVMRLW